MGLQERPHRPGRQTQLAVAIQLETWCHLTNAQLEADPRPPRILQSRDPWPSHSQGQEGGISSLDLPRVLHVPF